MNRDNPTPPHAHAPRPQLDTIQLHTPTGIVPGPCPTEASAGETMLHVTDPKKGKIQVKAVVLQFVTATGPQFYYFDPESALAFADAIREAAGGLVLAPPPGLIVPVT